MMDSLDFTEEEIQEQLALLGYKNIPKHRLLEFKNDLNKLIQSEGWQSSSSPPQINSTKTPTETSRASPPAYTKEKVSQSNFDCREFFLNAGHTGEQVLIRDQHSPLRPQQRLADSYAQHSVAPKLTLPPGAPSRLQVEPDPDQTLPSELADSCTSSPDTQERRFIKRKVLRKHKGQSLVCDESVYSEDSAPPTHRPEHTLQVTTMYKTYNSQSDQDDKNSLYSSFWSDGERQDDDEEEEKKVDIRGEATTEEEPKPVGSLKEASEEEEPELSGQDLQEKVQKDHGNEAEESAQEASEWESHDEEGSESGSDEEETSEDEGDTGDSHQEGSDEEERGQNMKDDSSEGSFESGDEEHERESDFSEEESDGSETEASGERGNRSKRSLERGGEKEKEEEESTQTKETKASGEEKSEPDSRDGSESEEDSEQIRRTEAPEEEEVYPDRRDYAGEEGFGSEGRSEKKESDHSEEDSRHVETEASEEEKLGPDSQDDAGEEGSESEERDSDFSEEDPKQISEMEASEEEKFEPDGIDNTTEDGSENGGKAKEKEETKTSEEAKPEPDVRDNEGSDSDGKIEREEEERRGGESFLQEGNHQNMNMDESEGGSEDEDAGEEDSRSFFDAGDPLQETSEEEKIELYDVKTTSGDSLKAKSEEEEEEEEEIERFMDDKGLKALCDATDFLEDTSEKHKHNQHDFSGDQEEDDDEEEAKSLSSSSESPAPSMMTSGYGTYRPEEHEYRDDHTIAEFDQDSRGDLSEVRDEDDFRSLCSFGGFDVEHTESDFRIQQTSARFESKDEFGRNEVLEEQNKDEDLCAAFKHTGTTPEEHLFKVEPEATEEERHYEEKSREHEDEDEAESDESSSNKDIKFIDSNADFVWMTSSRRFDEWEGNLRHKQDVASCLEERLAELRVSPSARHESEIEDAVSQSETLSSDEVSMSAFESYTRGMTRSHSDGDVRPKPKSFIRPAMTQQTRKRTDPVAKYFQYKQLWDMFKLPGEADRKAIRREIQEQLAYQPPPPKPRRVYVPNTYIVPTEKKRSALRWEIRTDLANGLLPHSYRF